MTREQRIVLTGALSGIGTMLIATYALYRLLPVPMDAAPFGYAAKWVAVAAIPYFAMLAAVGNERFLSEAIDPTRGAESKAMQVNGRVADNTGQQLLVFGIGAFGVASGLPAGHLQLIGAAAIWFVIARIAFWIGYRIDPLYRAFGFSSTAYLNLGMLGAALWLGFAG